MTFACPEVAPNCPKHVDIAHRGAFRCTKPIALAGQASNVDWGEVVRIYQNIVVFSAK